MASAAGCSPPTRSRRDMDPRFRVLDELRGVTSSRTGLFGGGRGGCGARGRAGGPVRRRPSGSPRLRDLVVGVHEQLRSQGVDPPRLPDPGPPVRSVKEKDETAAAHSARGAARRRGPGAHSPRCSPRTTTATESSRRSARAPTSRTSSSRRWSSCAAPGPWERRSGPASTHLMVDEFQDTNRAPARARSSAARPRDAALPGRRRVPVDLPASATPTSRCSASTAEPPRAPTAQPRSIPLRGNFRHAARCSPRSTSPASAMLGELRALRGRAREPAAAPGGGPAWSSC